MREEMDGKMFIGINGNDANYPTRVGVGQYAYGLISHLAPLASSAVRFRIYLENKPKDDLPKASTNWQYQLLPPRKLWTLTSLQQELLREKMSASSPDVFFNTSHYLPLVTPGPAVISIMDMSFERFPEYFQKKDLYQLKYWTWLSAKQATKILTISEFSKNEICALYHFDRSKVVVTLPGFDSHRFNDKIKTQHGKIKKIIQKYKIKGPYLIFLGTLQPRKNLTRLIEAFSQIDNQSINLVIVGMSSEGRGGWMYQQFFDKVKELGLSKRVIFTGYVPDEEVPFLFSGSRAYILPSLYEGFGIPPVEAMATGVPVIVSRVSSLPEICGEAATYIDDPYNTGSIKASLEKVLSLSPSEREHKIEFGLEFVKRYNWNDTAKKTLEILMDVAKE